MSKIAYCFHYFGKHNMFRGHWGPVHISTDFPCSNITSHVFIEC